MASETFLIAWRRLADIPEPPLPWLLGVARNLLRQQFGHARRQRRLADQITALTTEADLRAWDTGEHVVERAAALDAFGSLSGADAEALTLITWLGLDATEAAAVVGCSLLTGPVTPGTRAAVYGLLAEQPGLMTATNVTDPLGRVGTAIGDGNGDFLVISPATADVLDQTTYPVRPGATIPATQYGTEAYLSLSWTNQLP